ncbi:MAG: glycine zipper 2TM domain-containing protein [Comamonadaceae bacterium]|nr:MAG: glycine zipper 2TM domain-containing protein [Comamonadaceae bacterium]
MCQLAFVPQAAHAQQRNAAPVITGFDVDQVRRASPGTDLVFTLYGTPGADARISIAGVPNQYSLPETEPGVYVGSYTIRNSDRLDALTNVRANLRIGNRTATTVLNESLVAGAPWRSRPGSVPTGIPPRIQSFGVAPLPRLEPGADLDFTLTGTPGGLATVRVRGIENPIALTESGPGTYRGSYTIRNRDRVAPDANVTADLRVGQRNTVATLRDPLFAVANVPPPQQQRPVARACLNCGVIEAINPVEQKGDGSFVGLIGGGLAGAVLGNQVGKGSGRTAAQILGAVGGAYAGREIEKNVRKTTHYEVITRLETGATQSIVLDNAPEFRVGDRVRIENNTLMPVQ